MLNKYLPLVSKLLILLTQCGFSQNSVDDSAKTIVYVSAGLGAKYHVTNLNKWTLQQDVYQNHLIYFIDLGADFNGNEKHIFGLQFVSFPYVYGDHEMEPHNATLLLSFYYRRNIPLWNNLKLFPSTGISIFCNDPAEVFGLNLDLAIAYNINTYEFFIKNSSRLSPFMLHNTPWFLMAGITAKL